MKTIVLAGALFAMLGSVAMATDPMPLTGGSPVTDAQKAAFSKICLKNSGGNSTLCTCKSRDGDEARRRRRSWRSCSTP